MPTVPSHLQPLFLGGKTTSWLLLRARLPSQPRESSAKINAVLWVSREVQTNPVIDPSPT